MPNAKPFTPPTVEEVAAYARQLCYQRFDAERFFDHWEMRGWWVTPKLKMTSWKAAVRTWQRNAREWGKAPTAPGQGDPAVTGYADQAIALIRDHAGQDIGRLYDKIEDALGPVALAQVRARVAAWKKENP